MTYAGHPLYYYAGDAAAGDTNGQGLDAFGAKWYVMGTERHATHGSAARARARRMAASGWDGCVRRDDRRAVTYSLYV